MRFIFPLFCVLFSFQMKAQEGYGAPTSDSLNQYCFPDFVKMDSSFAQQYPFVSIEKNNFQFYSVNSPNWEHFYKEMDSMIRFKDRKLNFYHIGGSHIQADIYSHDMRTFLQS